MLSFLLLSSSFLNFAFYIYAIGFVVALVLEQFVKRTNNERNIYIVEYNRKYLWRNAWIINIFWFMTNIGLFVISRNMQTPVDNFWSEGL
tara:strand:- start:3373 stop:3642 length:270 start_codon:yes stop_codon:yes gene_type:complete